MVLEVEHPRAGKLKLLGIPVKLSEAPGEIKTLSTQLWRAYSGYSQRAWLC